MSLDIFRGQEEGIDLLPGLLYAALGNTLHKITLAVSLKVFLSLYGKTFPLVKQFHTAWSTLPPTHNSAPLCLNSVWVYPEYNLI